METRDSKKITALENDDGDFKEIMEGIDDLDEEDDDDDPDAEEIRIQKEIQAERRRHAEWVETTYEQRKRHPIRAITLGPQILNPQRKRSLALLHGEYKEEAEYAEQNRPRTRADCVDGERPCPWVTCRFHLALDVRIELNGSLKLNFPNPIQTGKNDLAEIDFDAMHATCTLDVAEREMGVTLEEVGIYMNLTRERVRQTEKEARGKIQKFVGRDDDGSIVIKPAPLTQTPAKTNGKIVEPMQTDTGSIADIDFALDDEEETEDPPLPSLEDLEL